MTVSSVPSGLFKISCVQLVLLILFRFSRCQQPVPIPSFKGLSCHSSTKPGLGFFTPVWSLDSEVAD